MKASDNIFPKVEFLEGAAPATPAANNVRLYAKADGLLYSKDDAGTETPLGGGTPGGADTQVQFNDAGSLGGDAGMVYDKTTNTLTVEDITTTGLLLTAASATGGAGLRAPHGTAPTTPTNGDLWSTTGGFFGRVNGVTVGPFAAAGAVADGDYGDITVSGVGTAWAIDPGAVSYAKIQDVSAASKLLGRGSAGGAGDVEEITLGTGLTMTGTTLSAGGSATAGWQIGYARTVSTTTATTTDTSIPLDATIPQITEGVAYASLDTTITPVEAASLLEVEVVLPVAGNSVINIPVALFRDSGANAIHATMVTVNTGYQTIVVLRTVVAAGSTSATTFKVRWCVQSGTGYILNAAGTNFFGASAQATMTVREIKQ